MFGPAFIVKPVTDPGAATSRLYLPQALWYDFWSAVQVQGPKMLETQSPLDRMPVYVRAGSIVPMGPQLQWSMERPADPIELRVYRGASGAFTLYEDENDNYDYEKGIHATIHLRWDDVKQTLTIGEWRGQFPGMLGERTFRVVFVGENHGAGIEAELSPDKIVQYSGKEIRVTP